MTRPKPRLGDPARWIGRWPKQRDMTLGDEPIEQGARADEIQPRRGTFYVQHPSISEPKTGKIHLTGKQFAMQIALYTALDRGDRVLIVDPKDLENWELLEKAMPLPEVEDDDHLGPYERPGYLRAVGDDDHD